MMRNYQQGMTLIDLIKWAVVLMVLALLGMKVAPTTIEYYKIMKDAKATAAQMKPDSTVADVRRTFDKFAEVDVLDIKSADLDVSKNNGRIIIEFAYEKRIHLFYNVSLLIAYSGSTEN